MKYLYTIIILTISLNFQAFSQQSGLDSWSIGTGVTNFSMQGDLTSDSANIGYYMYLNKMVSPAFGFEIKGQVLSMSGNSQDLSSEFPVFNTTTNADNLRFEGDSYGIEFNLVINMSRLTSKSFKNRKFGFSSYFGLGYHSYSAKLFDNTTDDLIIDYSLLNGINGGQGDDPKSIYFTTGIGLKYKLSNRIDLELRHSLNFNNEDHLDATISSRQQFETFHTTQLGIVVKLHKKGNEHIIWQDEIEEIVPKEEVVEEPNINLIDTDGDGVIDQFDKEPNTDKNAFVYANGVTIDSDKDGVPDHLDKCPLIAGNDNNGCPEKVVEPVKKETKPTVIDSDNDGVPDDKDACPQVYSLTNNGCPEVAKPVVKVVEPVKKPIIPVVKPVKPIVKKEEPKVIEPVKPVKKEIKPVAEVVKPEVVKPNNTNKVKETAKEIKTKKISAIEAKKRKLELEVRKNNPVYKQERAIVEEIIAIARKKNVKETVSKPIVKSDKEAEFKKNPNYEKIKELNKNSIKHNIPELDNAVSPTDVQTTPLYPGCEDQDSNDKKKTCLIAQVTIHSLKNFNTSQFSNLKLNKGINTIRVVFVINANGESSVQKVVGDWDDKVKKEAKRVISTLPKIQPGLLDNNPTSVKYSIKLPFKIK